MKTKFNLLFVLCLCFFGSYGQTCNDVQISTPPFGGDLELTVDLLLDDADASATYTFTPSSISCDDVGTTVSVVVDGPAGFTCNSIVTVVDEAPPVVIVVENIVVSLTASGVANLFPDQIDNGSYDNCSPVTLSISPSTITCDDIPSVDVFLTVTDEAGNFNQTWTTVIVEDKLAPIIFANDYVNISFDQNGEVNVTVDMIEEGGGNFDNCSEVTKTVTPSFFDCDDAGEQNVILSAADEYGNVTAVVSVVNLEDKIAPTPIVVNLSTALLSTGPGDLVPTIKVYAEDFDLGSYDNCGIVDMAINKEVFTCEDIGENEVIFTVYDAAGNSNSAVLLLDIIDNSTTSTAIACNDEVIYSTFQDLPYTVTPYDILEGGPYGCDFIFYLEIEDENGDVIPNNLVTADYLGQTLTYTIFDWNSSNTCWGNIIISDEDPDCEFEGSDDISWPLSLIELDLLNVEASEVTPEYIGNQADYTYADAYPTIDAVDCNLIAIAYSDIVLPSGLFSYKILRQFTVLDWLNYNEDTQEGLYEFDQIIKNNNYPAWYICDTLPRSAPLGDCDSGHTFDDDVEWPNDLSIEDHRITPTELINYSGVVFEDSEPQFSGEDSGFYSYSYQDLVGSLSTDALTVNRVWTVTHLDIPGIDFTYTQEIEVVFTEFSNLVAVNTHGSRAVAEVQLGNNIMTNQFGKAIVEDEFIINPEFSTAPLNGLDIIDLYLMRQHILDINQLDEHQVVAADVNGVGGVTTLDLVTLSRIIAGIEDDTEEWSFVDVTNNNTGLNNIKGHYVAIKTGDIDDSALLPGGTALSFDNVNLTFNDQLLNAGNLHSIPFYSDAMINASGIELRMKYEPSLMDIENVTSEIFGDQIFFDANANTEILTILVTDVNNAHLLDGTEILFEVQTRATGNILLHSALDFSEGQRSFMFDEELNKYRINGTLENEIGNVGTNDNEFAMGINIFPNPSVNFINVDLSQTNIKGDYSITLFDSKGRQVLTQRNNEVVQTSTLLTGSYLLYLSSGENYYSQIVQVYR